MAFASSFGGGRHAAAFGLFVLACLCKPTAMCFPLLAFAIHRTLFRDAKASPAAYAPMLLVPARPVVESYAGDVPAYSRVLGRDPGHWRALRVIGYRLCGSTGDVDRGVEMLRRSLAAKSSRKTLDALAYALACRGAEGDFEEAKKLGRAVGEVPARDKEGLMLDALGIVAMREGRDELAVRYFSAALAAPRRTHSKAYAALYLGQALANAGRKADAAVLATLRECLADAIENAASPFPR